MGEFKFGETWVNKEVDALKSTVAELEEKIRYLTIDRDDARRARDHWYNLACDYEKERSERCSLAKNPKETVSC